MAYHEGETMPVAMTLLGFTFSGREALIVGLVVVVVIPALWWVWRRRR